MLAPNTILQNRYRVVRLLGQGGMGAVYEAIDQRVSSVVALKETLTTRDSEARKAFEREAAILANLRHPSLPKVMDYFSENESDFLVMEFIPGHDLAELLELRGGPFSQAQVLRWADALLSVLGFLHGKQLLHRDIKPANLKLTQEGEIFLLDFGLAKGSIGQMPTAVTSKSVRGYTPVYASLEQIHGQGTDIRSDLYSLGATLYHLLTGVAPIDAPTRFHTLEEEQPDPLPPIQDVNPEISLGVAAVIHSAMAISRKHRPANANEMLSALGRAESDRPERKPVVPVSPDPTIPSPPPTQPAAYQHLPTMPAASPPPRVEPIYDGRIFSVAQSANAEPVRAGSILKPILLVAGGLFLLTALSVALVIWRTGWAPWQEQNLYQSKLPDATNSSTPTKSASPVDSPTPVVTPKPTLAASFINQQGIPFVLIRPGHFMMGSTSGREREAPVHSVTINYSFYMGKYEVTQAQWFAVMDNNPSFFKECGGDCPVEMVRWDEAQKFVQKLNQKNDGFTYRLPTEAEWEYACRAGTTGDYYAEGLSDIAWYEDNSGRKSHVVGSKQPNAFGLYDMSGNVGEWCEDFLHANYLGAPVDGSAWLTIDSRDKYRVLRGGNWNDSPAQVRSSYNTGDQTYAAYSFVGLRVVAVPR